MCPWRVVARVLICLVCRCSVSQMCRSGTPYFVAGRLTDNAQIVSDCRGSALWMCRTDTSYYLADVAEENVSEVSWAFVRGQGSMTLTTG